MIITGIVENLKSEYLNRSTQELLAIWQTKGTPDETITEEGFEAIRQILVERGIDAPNQEPSKSLLEVKSLDFEVLQNASNYKLLRKKLKSAGIGDIIWGIIAIALGIVFMEDYSINAILVLIGLFLLVVGIWLISAPRPTAMIMDSISLLIVGVWNILITLYNINLNSSNSSFYFFGVLGVLQIIGGFQSFGLYKSGSLINKPSDETLRQIDDLAKTITKANAEEQHDIIKFETFDGFWKVRLSQDSAIFIKESDGDIGSDTVFTPKDNVDFVTQGKVLFGKTLRASFRIGDRNLNGEIEPEHFERFKAWKATN